MAATTMVQMANSPTLKRAFTPDLVPNQHVRAKKFEQDPLLVHSQPQGPLLSFSQSYHSHSTSCGQDRSGQRPRSRGLGPPGRPIRARKTSMPVQTSARSMVPMPSFMSVFGEEVNNTGLREYSERNATGPHGSTVGRPASSGNLIHNSTTSNLPFSTFHQHRGSTSTSASESSDSSPTTTISTMDSSSMTEPSPGPSPESPNSKMIPSSFVADLRSRRTDNNSADSSPNNFFELQRPTTPAKKPRNLKNLGINTNSALSNVRGSASATLPVLAKKENVSAPSSPSFIKPPTPPKRRPSALGLSIQTPGSNENKPMRLVIPSTPSFNRPALRHFQSSPSLPLLSPSVLPKGGMQFPALRPIKTNPHGFAEVPVETEEEEDQEPNFDIPQSREEKPAAYPHGPICIYESGVYLYFEPTADQASDYDVIFNVASEVKNPFTASTNQDSIEDLEARRRDGKPLKKSGAETIDFAAIPAPPQEASGDYQTSSPTTPKATPIAADPLESNKPATKAPEYIHIPWEHNTDIVPDLYRLVQIIEDRVQQGKRVLVHCQCGVSRSASLIVAYGLYKNPGISVQEAYDAVKKRSKWIGPNMNLIMQLQEFRNGLLRANGDRAFHNQVYGLSMPRKSAGLPTAASTGNTRHSPFEMDTSPGARTPRTAPLPPESESNLQRASTGNMMSLSPGPLSAPSGAFFSPGYRRSWASSQTNYDLSPGPGTCATPYVDPKGHVVPILNVTQTDSPNAESKPDKQSEPSEKQMSLKPLPVPNFSRQLLAKKSPTGQGDNPVSDISTSISSPRSEEFHMAPLRQDDFDESFGLLSPRAATFDIPPVSQPGSTNSSTSSIYSRSSTDSQKALHPQEDSTGPSFFSAKAEPKTLGTSDLVDADEPMMSPRATEFHMTPFKQDDFDEAYGLLSPRATSFDISPPSSAQASHKSSHKSKPSMELVSPTTTDFPKDIFPSQEDSALEVTSPRSEEFHMTPLKPKLPADEDPFGLTSPRIFEFPKNPFESITPPREPRISAAFPRNVQPIHPPSHDHARGFDGFGSLNGTAHFEPAAPASALSSFHLSSPPGRIDSLNSPPPEPRTPKANEIEVASIGQPASEPQRQKWLTTPLRQAPLRTRFSSPNMREQRRLLKVQTEMEAMLPPRSPGFPPAADDIDALMSPRAIEFTKNPFHADLNAAKEEPSPASSTETVKQDTAHREWKQTLDSFTPAKPLEQDPRSPVQDSSPITRNIWDVL